MTILMATHDPEVLTIADHIIRIRDGAISGLDQSARHGDHPA